MKMILLGFYSDGSNINNGDQLLMREIYLGAALDDQENVDAMNAQEKAYDELSAAQEAVKVTNAYGRTLIVLEPDEE